MSAPSTEAVPPDLARWTGFLVRRAQQRHVATWARVVSPEISSVQYSVLAVLAAGAMSQRELCDAVDLDRSTIADLVARMERRGLVTRTPDPDDGRRKVVEPTALGETERARLLPLVEQVEEELTAQLDETTLTALRAGLAAMLDVSHVEDRPLPATARVRRIE